MRRGHRDDRDHRITPLRRRGPPRIDAGPRLSSLHRLRGPGSGDRTRSLAPDARRRRAFTHDHRRPLRDRRYRNDPHPRRPRPPHAGCSLGGAVKARGGNAMLAPDLFRFRTLPTSEPAGSLSRTPVARALRGHIVGRILEALEASMQTINRRPLILAVGTIVFLCACSQARHETTEVYYLVTANTRIAYWQEAAAGLAAAGKDLGVRAGPWDRRPMIQRRRRPICRSWLRKRSLPPESSYRRRIRNCCATPSIQPSRRAFRWSPSTPIRRRANASCSSARTITRWVRPEARFSRRS